MRHAVNLKNFSHLRESGGLAAPARRPAKPADARCTRPTPLIDMRTSIISPAYLCGTQRIRNISANPLTEKPMAGSITDRMRGAAMLDVATYEEVEADTTATGQAAIVVGIVAICGAIGGIREGSSGVIAGVLGAFISWMVWAGVTFVVGEKMFGGTATWGELLRTLGFAQAPGVLYLLGIIPVLGTLVQFAVAIWIMVAGVIAIRQALDFTTGKAVITAIVAFLVMLVVGAIMAAIFGLGRAMF